MYGWEKFRAEYSVQISTVSHQKLMGMMKELRAITKERYGGGAPPKVELVERGFTEKEFRGFMAVVEDDDDRAMFMLMAVLGLRVGEATALRGRDLEGDQLRVHASKGGFGARIRLPPFLLSIIPAREPHEKLYRYTHKRLRDRFASYRQEAGLDDIYLITEPCGRSGTKNPRYRLSLHSLRHFAIQRVYSKTKDADLTRRFARHRHMETTERYLRSSRKDEIEKVMESLAQPIKAYSGRRLYGN